MCYGHGMGKGWANRDCNKVIQELRSTSDAFLRIVPIGLEDGIWVVFSDASLGNDGDKSQGGFLVAPRILRSVHHGWQGGTPLHQQLEKPPTQAGCEGLSG